MNALGVLNVEATDNDGRTALAIAASQGSLESVKYLISVGGNPSIRDARNNDAIKDAQREGKDQVVSYLKGVIDNQVIQDYCSDFNDGLLRKGLQ